MYEPACDDEITGLVRHIDQQLDALRAAIIGLTDEQARTQPCRSVLSIAGLLKHVTGGMHGATARLTGHGEVRGEIDEAAYAAYLAEFSLTDHETSLGALAAFDAARGPYLAAIASTDPDAVVGEPPAPWHGIYDVRPARARYFLVHQIEELARHAGHADILREQIDGMAVPTVVLSQAGAPANDFFQPYEPAAGTIGAAR
jgi:hypothetical protein